jgi:hypothetical protein
MKRVLFLALLLMFATQLFAADPSAHYSVTFARSWSAKTHPFEYPEANLISGPHFSGLIGATHHNAYTIFRQGAKPTPGLEKLSEEGKHAPLDSEIKAAIAAGKAGMLFETGPLRDEGGSEMFDVTVTSRFPSVAAVAMIAPSPDWFAGADVNLMENGQWVAKKTVDLWAYDSGGDDGTTYKASDKDNNPKKPTMSAKTKHFVANGKVVHVGTLTFVKK